MKTKKQEREALQKIEAIIESMGKDSYIGMAFAGCCEMAADNIENDFANSMMEQRDYEAMEGYKKDKIISKLEDEKKTAEARADLEERTAIQWKEDCERWEDRYNREFSRREEAEATGSRLVDEKVSLEQKLEEAKREIVELKAKLYDFLTNK